MKIERKPYMPNPEYRIEFLARPGRHLGDAQLERLSTELRAIAAECFDEIPDYQCLRGTREEFADKVITVARRPDGTAAGFCSAALLPVEHVGEVFHLGLTCVRQADRGTGLTHKLTSRVLIQYLLRHRPFGRLWISNVACVLSSLGNVAMHFEDVWPSPYVDAPARPEYYLIAEAIDRHHRDKIYIATEARFDWRRFVFRGSVAGTAFQKDAGDVRFRHRHDEINGYYEGVLDFHAGDEVLQVGHVSLLTGLKYRLKRRRAKSAAARPVSAPVTAPERWAAAG
jgi:hypothetical protein